MRTCQQVDLVGSDLAAGKLGGFAEQANIQTCQRVDLMRLDLAAGKLTNGQADKLGSFAK